MGWRRERGCVGAAMRLRSCRCDESLREAGWKGRQFGGVGMQGSHSTDGAVARKAVVAAHFSAGFTTLAASVIPPVLPSLVVYLIFLAECSPRM
eukprot:197887-Chlamydomonas_euryale.AAC.5